MTPLLCSLRKFINTRGGGGGGQYIIADVTLLCFITFIILQDGTLIHFPGQGAGMQAAMGSGEPARPASPPAPWEMLQEVFCLDFCDL